MLPPRPGQACRRVRRHHRRPRPSRPPGRARWPNAARSARRRCPRARGPGHRCPVPPTRPAPAGAHRVRPPRRLPVVGCRRMRWSPSPAPRQSRCAHLRAPARAGGRWNRAANRVCIGIQQRAFGETPGAFGALPGVQRVLRAHIVDQDAAALRAQRAFNIDVACTEQRDRLPWIDRHQCILANPKVTAHAVALRTQADARTRALADAPARRIGAVQRRVPRCQCGRPVGRHPRVLGQAQAWQGSDQPRAIGHLHTVVAIDVVLREATAEQAGVQSQRCARQVRISHPHLATGPQREGTTALSSTTEPASLAQLHPATAVGRHRTAVRLQADAAALPIWALPRRSSAAPASTSTVALAPTATS